MNYIEEFCSKIGIINNGEMVSHGSLHDIKRNYVRDRLVVRTEYPEKIIEKLGSQCTAKESGELIIKLKSPDDKQRMMRELTDNFDIDEIKVYEPSLNDIFVQYTSNGEQEDKNETV